LPPHPDGLFAERYGKALSHKAQGARLFTNTIPVSSWNHPPLGGDTELQLRFHAVGRS
jgi:hypothetical protein